MSTEPVIVEQRVTAPEAVLLLSVTSDLECFTGHFPGAPVVPGVVQLGWAVSFAQRLLDLAGKFARIEALKFQHVMTPGIVVTLTLQWSAAQRKLSFVYSGDARFSSGRVVFGADR